MTSERWQRLREVFNAAVERPPEDRSPFIKEACGDDAKLRREVEALLATYEGDPGFLEKPAACLPEALPITANDTMEGRHIGPYRILRRIGGGGMGAVYLAVRDDAQYRKHVAIKLLKPGMDSEDILRRFRSERQILASLDHPNIARLLDGGIADDGRPYFVMDHVEDGLPIVIGHKGRSLPSPCWQRCSP